MALAHLAARIFGTPLLVAPDKLEAILAVLGPRLGLDAIPLPAGPVVEPKERQPLQVDAEASIAVIQAIGTLSHRVDGIDALSGLSSYQTLAAELERALADPDVEGILLEVDSFGGEAAGCFDLADRIRAARETKPVFGVASQYAMSGGYALLSQASRVFVPQTGEVGSVGVVMTHVDLSGAEAQAGVRVTHVHAGARKVDLSPHRALSDAARARLEDEVGQIYEQFLAAVAAGRGERLSAEAARSTEAGSFIGQKAVDAGLADQVGDVDAARAALVAEIEERRMLKQLQAENARLLCQTTLQAETIRQLEAALSGHKAELAARREKDLDQIVEQLVADCQAARVSPPEKAERDDLRKALGKDEELGRKLVAAVRERCLASRSGVTTKDLNPAQSEADQKRRAFVAGTVKAARLGQPTATATKED